MPFLLAGYAVAVAAAGTWWLPRASWPQRAPRLGIAVWQGLTVTVVASALLAGLLLTVPCLRVWADWSSLRDCLLSARAQYASTGGALASTAGAVFTLAAAGRLAWFTGTAVTSSRRRRARHDEVLALVGRRGPVPGMVLLEDDRPAVYCVPGRRRIVFTTGALRRLDSRQLDAVLAHERAHLTGRHHLVIILAAAFRRAFPHVRFFAVAASQISCLVEMAADDAAARRAHRLTLADALLDPGRGPGSRRSPRRRRNGRGAANPAPHRLTAACRQEPPDGHFRPGASRSTGRGLLCARAGPGGHLALPAKPSPFPPGSKPMVKGADGHRLPSSRRLRD